MAFDAKVVGRKGGEPVDGNAHHLRRCRRRRGRLPHLAPCAGRARRAERFAVVRRRGKPLASRQRRNGSIIDGDLESFVVTFDNRPAKEDWFAVTLAAPVTIGRVVFAHGKNFHDGGWFDASAGKPQVQVKHEKNGPWETVGDAERLPRHDGHRWAIRYSRAKCSRCDCLSPVIAIAVRVVGVPACGDTPKQAFASCAELQATAQ